MIQFVIKQLITFFLLTTLVYSNNIEDRYRDVSLRIISSALSDSTAYNRLSYICDMFGPRLSGSKNLENAINWIIKEMKSDGFDNIQGERVKVPSWIRGKESIALLKPFNNLYPIKSI